MDKYNSLTFGGPDKFRLPEIKCNEDFVHCPFYFMAINIIINKEYFILLLIYVREIVSLVSTSRHISKISQFQTYLEHKHEIYIYNRSIYIKSLLKI